MKLKTLKDLKREADELSFAGYTIDTLRQEAIKWIKKLRECEKNGEVVVPTKLKQKDTFYREYILVNLDNEKVYPEVTEGEFNPKKSDRIVEFNRITAHWIKHFFNITEEDLENGKT